MLNENLTFFKLYTLLLCSLNMFFHLVNDFLFYIIYFSKCLLFIISVNSYSLIFNLLLFNIMYILLVWYWITALPSFQRAPSHLFKFPSFSQIHIAMTNVFLSVSTYLSYLWYIIMILSYYYDIILYIILYIINIFIIYPY